MVHFASNPHAPTMAGREKRSFGSTRIRSGAVVDAFSELTSALTVLFVFFCLFFLFLWRRLSRSDCAELLGSIGPGLANTGPQDTWKLS